MMPRAARPASRGGSIPEWVRKGARRPACQVCHVGYGGGIAVTEGGIWVPREHLDHVVPVRWCRQHGYDPNIPANILSTCHRCNLAKKGAEDALFGGRPHDYVGILCAAGWTEHLRRAFVAFGMEYMYGLLK